MAQDAEDPKNNQITESEAVRPDEPQAAVDQKDVLEEDDDFEEFNDEGYGENEPSNEEHAEWEDNWDDEVEGEDDYAKRLRVELEANASKMQ